MTAEPKKHVFDSKISLPFLPPQFLLVFINLTDKTQLCPRYYSYFKIPFIL